MKAHYTIALSLLLAATACSSIQEEPANTERVKNTADEVFYATLEQSGSASDTKANAELLKGVAPMKCYADDTASYSLNEITIYWNSPAVFVLAYFCSGYTA